MRLETDGHIVGWSDLTTNVVKMEEVVEEGKSQRNNVDGCA